MSKVRLLSIAVIALVLLNAAILAHFFIHGARMHGGAMGPQMFIIDHLELDDKQQKEFSDLIHVHKLIVEEKDAEMLLLKKELYGKLREGEEGNEKKIAEKIGAIQTEVDLIHFHHFEDLRRICRPDQLPAFESLVDELASIFDRQKGMPPPGKPHRK